MVVTKTPLRMSFFGGGTDLEDYFRTYGGAVLSTTVDQYCYVAVRHLTRFFDFSTELVYTQTERVTDVEQIVHPAIRNAMKLLDIRNIHLTCDADLPVRSGLGSSSAFAVGMLYAFHALRGERADKQRLAEEAIYLERTMCREAGGWQDQIAAAYGGLNRIDFGPDGYRVRPIRMDPERKARLNQNLLLFFTGTTRFSPAIQQENRGLEDPALLRCIYDLVDEAEQILLNGEQPLDHFGRLLDETWALKRQTGAHVSTAQVDQLYRRAIQAGALGGKLLGAGGGGFLLFYVPPERQEPVRQALKGLTEVPFRFEEAGTQLFDWTPRREEPLCAQ